MMEDWDELKEEEIKDGFEKKENEEGKKRE